jgi:hypothetical protein
MAFNVKNGTPLHGPSLCETCSRAHVRRGYRESELFIVCRATDPEYEVRFPVRDCSSYSDRNRQTLYDMEQIAWVLQPRGPKRQAGFVSPRDANEGDGEIELILDKEELSQLHSKRR